MTAHRDYWEYWKNIQIPKLATDFAPTDLCVSCDSECCGDNSECSGACKDDQIKKPQKWYNVYPQGTKTGTEEQAFFIAIARHTKFKFRSVPQLAKETNLTKERIEEIIQKYHKVGIILQNPKNEEQWGYWERCPELLPKKNMSVSDKDKKDRIKEEIDK